MYKLIRNSSSVLRTADRANIPDDERNGDRQAFIRWRDGWTEKLPDGTEVVHPPHEPEPADPEPPPTQDELDAAAARADAKLAALAAATPVQIRAWANQNFPTLTAAERDRLGTAFVALAILARRI